MEIPTRGSDYDKYLASHELTGTNATPFAYRTTDGFHPEPRPHKRRAAH